MLNEFSYCPRLAYLMWVQQEWADNLETLEGKRAHRRVDRAEGPKAELHNRSVHLTSETLGLTAVMDLIERDGNRARPVDYKRGKRPAVEHGAYEPERVQLCVQGLLLREHGYTCNEGLLYFVGSRERVRIRFTKGLVARTLELLERMRTVMGRGEIPPPLEDSPKCPRCSLVAICLPEEVRFLSRGGPVRPIAVADPATFPFVVQEPGAVVRLSGDRLVATKRRAEIGAARFAETSHVVLMGSVQSTTPALIECCRREITVLHMSGTGWLQGTSRGMEHKNVELRSTQFATARDSLASLDVARALVVAKIRNSRVLLRRNGSPSPRDLEFLARLAEDAAAATDADALLGVEGAAARTYYAKFSTLLKGTEETLATFDFEARSRQPPRDPINALLSFVSGLLTKDFVIATLAVGFDPYMGFYHRPRYGKPALALDLMEPYRPVVVDSVVLGVINNGEIGPRDFYDREGGVLLKPPARRRLLAAYERRLAVETRHALFGYQLTYRRLFELETRLLARYLTGETPSYRPHQVR
jgi:CRISPR-associated endonuclease Cas1/CRISPR-associated protein Cas4